MIHTKKSLGQHWLQDSDCLDAMCQAAKIEPSDTVLEIGPGPGTLTAKLVNIATKVIAVEFDSDLAKDLPKRVPATNLDVIQQDILKFDLTTLPKDYLVAANIPYYLTSNLLRVLCESSNPFLRAAILMQKEVAQRVCAEPGQMNVLGISVQFYNTANLGRIVDASLFTPPPKVDSQILILNRRSEPLFPDVDKKLFFRIVKAGFAQRRKTILNSLSSGLHIDKTTVTTALNNCQLRPATRAQDLSLSDWYNLYQEIKRLEDRA